jgi:hypothetical protein
VSCFIICVRVGYKCVSLRNLILFFANQFCACVAFLKSQLPVSNEAQCHEHAWHVKVQSDTFWRWQVSCTQALSSWQLPLLDTRLCGPRSGQWEEEKNLFSLLEIEPRFVCCPACSNYSDWAISAFL